jgi:hypothetical protein
LKIAITHTHTHKKVLVEWLKVKALSSNPRTTNKQTNKKEATEAF